MDILRRLFSVVLLGISAASLQAEIAYLILDQYNAEDVPQGTNYSPLTIYDEYVDAGSVDASPFVIEKLTTENPNGGIVFYGSTELQARDSSNTYRLSSGTFFNFESFNINQFESNLIGNGQYGDKDGSEVAPSVTITSNQGNSLTHSATFHGFDWEMDYSADGVQTLNWTNLTWVDFEVTNLKLHTSNYSLTDSTVAVPEPATAGVLLSALVAVFAMQRRGRRAQPSPPGG